MRRLIEIGQLSTPQRGAHRALGFQPPLWRQLADQASQRRTRKHAQAVAICNADFGQPLILPQGHFTSDPAHGGCDLHGKQLRKVIVAVPASPPTRFRTGSLLPLFRQFPDLGRLGRIRSVSRRKSASLTARRMKLARWRLAAGAILSMACNVASSKWTRTWGIL